MIPYVSGCRYEVEVKPCLLFGKPMFKAVTKFYYPNNGGVLYLGESDPSIHKQKLINPIIKDLVNNVINEFRVKETKSGNLKQFIDKYAFLTDKDIKELESEGYNDLSISGEIMWCLDDKLKHNPIETAKSLGVDITVIEA